MSNVKKFCSNYKENIKSIISLLVFIVLLPILTIIIKAIFSLGQILGTVTRMIG